MSRPVTDLAVYLITDRSQTRGRQLAEVVEAALSGGVRAVQLRERDLDARSLLTLATRLRELTARAGAALLINDRIDIALACDADGVHLPASSYRVADARTLLGPDRLIAVSTHRADEVATAASDGADFVVFGPVFETPSKQPYGPPVGCEALERVCRTTKIPVIAIGGVTAANRALVRQAGAAGVAVIRAVMAADDPAVAAHSLRQPG